jgi:putative hemolysin
MCDRREDGRMSPHRITPAFLIAAGVVAVAACTPPAASAPPPTASSGPPSPYVVLTGVSCTSARYCMAVGTEAAQGRTVPVAEAWDGRRWLGQRVPGPTGSVALASQLDAVSCSGPSRCVAVGTSHTASSDVAFADFWNGTRWRLLPLSYPAGSTDLIGVSCRDSMCLLTGLYLSGGQELPLAFELDGTAWRRLTPAIPPGQAGVGLAGVWCTTPSACMVVGSYDQAQGQGQGSANLAEEWDGLRWRVLRTASPAGTGNGPGLVAVACPITVLCLAVGSYNDISRPGREFAVREIWQHGRWQMVHLPGPQKSTPAAVACPSSSNCITVGGSTGLADGRPGAEQWTGGSLRYLPVPYPQAGTLTAISCAGPRVCMAVGNGTTAFAELWNGSDWQLLSTP